jgi:ClpP class serine protease
MADITQNRFIAPILSGQLLIDADFAFDAYLAYLQEVQLLSAGAPYAELGIGARRHEQAPLVVSMAGGNVIHDTYRLYSDEPIPAGSIAHLKLSGVMRSDSAASTRGIDALERDLRQAYSNPNIEAVILEINSGGGEAVAAWKLHNVIQERNKAVVSYVHVAGSGAYLAAIASDEIIVASKGSRLGSIGALFSIDKRLLVEYSENMLDVYADQSPNKNLEMRSAVAGDFGPLKKEANRVAVDFQNAVRSNRELLGDEQAIAHTLSGPMFPASESIRRGMADMTGNFNLAARRAMLWSKRRKKQTT